MPSTKTSPRVICLYRFVSLSIMGYDTVIYETNAPTRCLSTYGTKQWGISDGISYDSIRGFDVLKEGFK
ncbi:hypothetical protein Bamy01_37850 [Bacillus amyloliquefaciens]|nr:hypothetical protein Bamy01_37850 [Bacillus amyloliquefaciens]